MAERDAKTMMAYAAQIKEQTSAADAKAAASKPARKASQRGKPRRTAARGRGAVSLRVAAISPIYQPSSAPWRYQRVAFWDRLDRARF